MAHLILGIWSNKLSTLGLTVLLKKIGEVGISIMHFYCITVQSKKEGKDQESIQSSATPDPGYQWENNKLTIRHHKRVPRG